MKSYGSYTESGAVLSPEYLLEADTLAWDSETTGLSRLSAYPHGIAVCMDKHRAYWIPKDHPALSIMVNKLQISHNSKYDLAMMKNIGITVPLLPIDTMIAAHMIGRTVYDLKTLAMVDLGKDHIDFTDIGKSFEGMDYDAMAKFSGLHAIHTLELWNKYERKLKMLGSYDLFMNTEMPLIPLLADMERAGVAVDHDRIVELGTYFKGKQTEIEGKLNQISPRKGINYNSPHQVGPILFEDLGVPIDRRTKKENKPSVDARQLEKHRDKFPFVDLYLQYKGYSTLIDSYSDSLVKDIIEGRIYCSFNQTGTVTGRLSSSKPNLQKIPKKSAEGKKIRTAFIAPRGYVLLRVDANQLELRIAGICSNDENIINAYLSGRDMHDETARRVFGGSSKRREAKNLNFKIIYGGAAGIEETRFKKA